MSTLPAEGASAGWLRMTRHALGLSVEDLSFILDVNRDHIRKVWERGVAPIPEGVVQEIHQFVEFTDTIVDVLTGMAEESDNPAIVVYRSNLDVPHEHIAAAYGVNWWDHIAYRVVRDVPSVFLGTALDVAEHYGIPVREVHTHPGVHVMHIDAPGDTAARRIARRRNEPPVPEWA